jgi:mono/diheme cytochrome c family protein
VFDIAGVTVLVVLIVVFSFLTTRTWRLGNAFLKWAGVFITGLLALIPAALLVLALIGFSKLNARYDNPVTAIQVAGTPAQIARGEKLAPACSSCHSPGNELPLSGSNFAAKFDLPPLGTLYAPNLTPSGNIKDWTDGQVIRAIREGVDVNGRSLLVMPAGSFRNISDEDVQALVAYLRSQPSVGGPTPETQFNLLGAIFTNLADFRTAQSCRLGRGTRPNGTTCCVFRSTYCVVGVHFRSTQPAGRNWTPKAVWGKGIAVQQLEGRGTGRGLALRLGRDL